MPPEETKTKIKARGAILLLLLFVPVSLGAVVFHHHDAERPGTPHAGSQRHGGTVDVAVMASVHQTLDRELMPGFSQPVDLDLRNPSDRPLTVRNLTLRVRDVRAPRADAAHPCSAADFSAVGFSGPYGFTVPASTTRSLAELGIPRDHWPRVGMHNTVRNQDGCKGARLRFSFEVSDHRAAAPVAGDA